MKNLAFFVKQLEESDEKDIINNAKKLIRAINNQDDNESLLIDSNQQIFFFPSQPNLEPSLCDRIFDISCSKPFLLESESNLKILISLITQIASFDFDYFVDNYVPKMVKGDEKMHSILANVASIILNPLSGFLYHILSMQKYFDNKKKYDFFDHQSPDLNTPIGQTLTKFRKAIIDQILKSNSSQKKHILFNTSKSFYTYSIFYPYKHSEIPPYNNFEELSLGFPKKNESLYLSSYFLNQGIYTKEKRYSISSIETLIKWEKYFKEITGFDVYQKTKEIPLFHMKSSDDCPALFQYLKLIPFLALPSLETIINDEMELLAIILGEDPISASFYQCLCQILILNDEKFSVKIFDSILTICDNLGNLSDYQYHTLIHSICRFIEVLSISETCPINNNHIDKLNSLALVGFCSMHIEIRRASLKLFEALGNLNPQLCPIYDFIDSSEELFEYFIYNFFESYEKITSLILPIKKPPKSPLTLEIAINSPSSTIWQICI